ncbi:MAG: glutamine synthetase III [Eubacteriales bacterium]
MQEERFDVGKDFGCNVFNDEVMRERLPKPVYRQFQEILENGAQLTEDVAASVAHAMKEWAIEKGATHYTHWFQPLNGMTAEKHDSFLSPTDGGKVIMEFSGKELIKGEPDASSFPSGGLRNTFEARGYTAWDCTSPAFLKKNSSGVTLCIPTAFCSYTGEALDEKTPLLRSMELINAKAKRVLELLGDTDADSINTTIGVEQEYFLIEKELFSRRKDLQFAGRTLLGACPPKGQEFEDHYFGVINERVSSYMKELDVELWKVGVTAKTKHNEVAPAQHELAPVYTTTNIACDQNQIIMETMQRVADHHGLACLLHEKPFSYINGSGKHNNWSISTSKRNLINPGKDPRHNIEFLLFLVAVIRAVDNYAELLRLTASTPGNDHRLGGNEAPPSIISIFLGEELTNLLDSIEEAKEGPQQLKRFIEVGVQTLPQILSDNSDRNRTSPFAFTGNKFEFRMLPASTSVSFANTVLNTAVAESLDDIANRLSMVPKEDLVSEVYEIVKDILTRHRKVIFNGNGYSPEWVAEAERRGLPNIRNMVDAVPHLLSQKSVSLFEKFGVLSYNELHARYEILLEEYVKQLHLEGKTMVYMVEREIIPAVNRHVGELSETILKVREVLGGAADRSQKERLSCMVRKMDQVEMALAALKEALEQEPQQEDSLAQAVYCRDVIGAKMEQLRTYCDQLETICPQDVWPLPDYTQLLFSIG